MTATHQGDAQTPATRRGPTDERHDDDAAQRHGSRCRRARPVRRRRHERPHGLGLVVDSVHRAGDLPQAPAPSVPGDLLVTTRETSPGRRGTPGGLFRVPAGSGTRRPRPPHDPHHRTDQPPTRTDDEAHERQGNGNVRTGTHRSHRRRTLAGRRALRRHAPARSWTCSSRSSSTTSCGPRRSASSARSRTSASTSAIERREPWGVWGGELFANGKVLANKRRRGRPPKVRAARAGARGARPAVRPAGGARAPDPTAHQVTAKAGRGDDAGVHLPPVPQRAPARRGQLRPLPLPAVGRLAQLVERRPYKAEVGGSRPSTPTASPQVRAYFFFPAGRSPVPVLHSVHHSGYAASHGIAEAAQ